MSDKEKSLNDELEAMQKDLESDIEYTDPNEDDVQDAVVVEEDDSLEEKIRGDILYSSITSHKLDDINPNSKFPNLVQNVIGFRSFQVVGKGLGQPQLQWWPSGKVTAQCKHHVIPTRRHSPPVIDCACGLYAYHDIIDFQNYRRYFPLIGAVKAWGRMCVARNGFRSQYAEVIALTVEGLTDPGTVISVEQIAKGYGIPLFRTVDELVQYAYTKGISMPDEMRPGGKVSDSPGMYVGNPSPPTGGLVGASSHSIATGPVQTASLVKISAPAAEKVHERFPDGNSVSTGPGSLAVGMLVIVLFVAGFSLAVLGNPIGYALIGLCSALFLACL